MASELPKNWWIQFQFALNNNKNPIKNSFLLKTHQFIKTWWQKRNLRCLQRWNLICSLRCNLTCNQICNLICNLIWNLECNLKCSLQCKEATILKVNKVVRLLIKIAWVKDQKYQIKYKKDWVRRQIWADGEFN